MKALTKRQEKFIEECAKAYDEIVEENKLPKTEQR